MNTASEKTCIEVKRKVKLEGKMHLIRGTYHYLRGSQPKIAGLSCSSDFTLLPHKTCIISTFVFGGMVVGFAEVDDGRTPHLPKLR